MSKESLNVGDNAPAFSLPDATEREVALEQFRGQWVVLYFYPKDNTSGCTTEALDFTAALPQFEQHNAVVIGISPDSCKSHQNFINKHQLKVLLLSDTDHKVLEAYGAWQLKRMYGREYMGVVRSTYLIDPQGTIRRIWPKVKVKGHVEEVLKTLVELQS